MQVTCRWIGMTAGSLLLVAVIVGCGAQSKPQATKTGTEAQSVSTATPVPETPATNPKPAIIPQPMPRAIGPKAMEVKPMAVKPTAVKPVVPETPATAPRVPESTPTARPPLKRAAVHRDTPIPGAEPDNGKLLLQKAEPEETGATEENPAADKDLPYSVVKVYYATDRAPRDVSQWERSFRGC